MRNLERLRHTTCAIEEADIPELEARNILQRLATDLTHPPPPSLPLSHVLPSPSDGPTHLVILKTPRWTPGTNPPNGWGRHPFPPPGGPGGGMPLPSPGYGPPGGPAGNGPVGPQNGMMGFAPAPHHPGHGPHPSFGNGAGMHLGSGVGMGMGYGMGMFGSGGQNGVAPGGSPPRPVESTMPMTSHWQNQLMRYEAARATNSTHHRARTAAMASRLSNKPNAVTISDPNHMSTPSTYAPTLTSLKKHTTSLSISSRVDTPPPGSESAGTPALSTVDPADPSAAPAPTTKEGGTASNEPWMGLDLGGVKLRTLSTALFTFTHITQLYVNHNALTSLPPAISSLRQLTLLDATGNELAAIPPEVGYLFKLEELLLFDNHLTTLPFELGLLYKLETLGIEGNPMDEKFKTLLAEKGTSGLIMQLRDEAPSPDPPPQRSWIEIETPVPHPSEGKQEQLTVLSYNILCPSFTPSSTYVYTPSWALDWAYRKGVILDEITNAAPEIVCLQEIDCEQYAEFFHPHLKKHGYEGCHYPRTRARTMAPEEAKVVDGCATFWKSDRFNLVETQVIEFNQVALQKIDMRTDDMFNRVMSRDNIAVVCNLELVASGARLMVCNSHIYWDHRYRDVKLVQIGMLMEELEKAVERFSALPPKLNIDQEYNHGQSPDYDRRNRGRDIPLVLCVDLNSTLDSAVYDFLSTGKIPPDHEDFMSHVYGTYTAKGLAHGLDLASVCAEFGGMKMTNYTPTFQESIDYIFYTPKNLQVLSVLGDVAEEYLEKTVGFPNVHFPSDHIPVFAQLRIKGKVDPNHPSDDKPNGYRR